MIGQHTDAPVLIYKVVQYEGDGVVITGSHTAGLFATPDAAAAFRAVYRYGPTSVHEMQLQENGQYQEVRVAA